AANRKRRRAYGAAAATFRRATLGTHARAPGGQATRAGRAARTARTARPTRAAATRAAVSARPAAGTHARPAGGALECTQVVRRHTLAVHARHRFVAEVLRRRQVHHLRAGAHDRRAARREREILVRRVAESRRRREDGP